MGKRDNLISKSILSSIFRDSSQDKRTILSRILAFFSFFNLKLARYKEDTFRGLREETWEVDEEEYKESFRQTSKDGKGLEAVGDLGYSGSVCSFELWKMNSS